MLEKVVMAHHNRNESRLYGGAVPIGVAVLWYE